MSFDANELKINRIFNGDSSFVIPRNQREYVWEEKNWRELADDIIYIQKNLENKRNLSHFIGSFVFHQNRDEYTIIDGQQRITTIMVMLASICAIQNEINDVDEFGKTKQYLLGNIGLSTQYQRLKNEMLPNLKLIISQTTDYKENIDKSNIFNRIPLLTQKKPDKLLKACFWFFYNLFVEYSSKTPEKLVEIRTIILDMKVIHIISEDELDCYEVFEVLNARGVSLKEGELLKNYIFKYVQPEYDLDIAKEKWKEITDNMEKCKNNLEQFLVHYFTVRFPKTNSGVNVFELVKNKIPKSDIVSLLDELVECSKYYVYFYDPEKYNDAIISDCLSFFNLENQRQFRPIFLAYFIALNKGKISEEDFKKAFTAIRNFYFSFGLICKNTSNLIETAVYKVANEIYNSENKVNAEIFIENFRKYYPSQETFTNHFGEKGYSNKNKLYSNSKNKKEIYYILSKFEEYFLCQEGGELKCDITKCNIEHIMNDSEFDDTACKIGNLLLIREQINSNIGNAPFSKKIIKYADSRLLNVKKYLEHYGKLDEWKEENIECRSKRLAKLAFEYVWKF